MLHANNDSEGQLELWVDKFYITSPPPPKKIIKHQWSNGKNRKYIYPIFFINPINWFVDLSCRLWKDTVRFIEAYQWSPELLLDLLQGACVQPLNWQYINTIDGWLHLLRFFKGLDCNFLALIAIKTATECLCLYMYEKNIWN